MKGNNPFFFAYLLVGDSMHLFSFLYRTLLTIAITLILLIMIKGSTSFKEQFYEKVYVEHFPFLEVNKWYQDLFGTTFPFQKYLATKPVFKENLSYSSKEPYLDGVKLTVEDVYPIPVIQTGLVVFVGEKEGYGNVVIVEQLDGISCWYGNLSTMNVNLYDYIEAGSLLGVADKELYLVFKEEGSIISYEKYLS